jgi:hypothetical protein
MLLTALFIGVTRLDFMLIDSAVSMLRARFLRSVMVKDRRGDQRGGGVNGSQLKFLKEFGLYPKLNPNPQPANFSGAET